MIQDIYIIDENIDLIRKLRELFKDDTNLRFRQVKTRNVETVLKNIPEIILINEDSIDINICELCKSIRSNEDNSITPLIVISSDTSVSHKLSVIKNEVEYFIEKESGDNILYYTIKNVARLLSVNRTVSPLTGLPGNVQIQTELKKRLLRKEIFEVLYLDLDNFKAYNDVYGFLKGDEIIKMTARLMTQTIHKAEDSDVFIGHIGGDDFVAILDNSINFEKVCQDIIAGFNVEIVKFFNEEDLEKGFLEVQNRKGIIEEFPLTSVSIGVVVADKRRFANILEIGEVGAQVKHLAKATMGNCYAINRRESE